MKGNKNENVEGIESLRALASRGIYEKIIFSKEQQCFF